MYLNFLRLAILVVTGLIITTSFAQTRKIFHLSHGGSSATFNYARPEVFGLYIPHEKWEKRELDSTRVKQDTQLSLVVTLDTASNPVSEKKLLKESGPKKKSVQVGKASDPAKGKIDRIQHLPAFVIGNTETDSGVKKPLLYALATAAALLTTVILKLRFPN